MKMVNSTHLRGDLFNILKHVVKKHEEYCVSSKAGDAVIISKKDYEGLLETLELMSIPGFRESLLKSTKDIQEGNLYSIEDVFGN